MTLHSDPRRLTGDALHPVRPSEAALPRSGLETTPVYDARVLTQGGVQARIVLDGQVYALRITRAGKLILTK